MAGERVVLRALPSRIGPPQSHFGAATKQVDPFYTSKAWRDFSARIRRERGLRCEACGKDCRGAPYGLRVDHTIARKDGGADFDPANVRCLCASCDNAKRAVERRERGRGG